MRTIKAESLTHDSFAPFGMFYPMSEPEGYSLDGELHRFFPDRVSESFFTRAGFSSIIVKRPVEMKIVQAKYHTKTPELILPFNDDMIIHTAPASKGKPVPALTRAFLVPKGTLVKINTAVWHLTPFPVSAKELRAMIILPECTYANDCTVVDLNEEEQFMITI